ncbi:MAG: MoaD/ThiS family protein [Planctomycetota bacterium]
MIVQVRLFAAARELIGADQLAVPLENEATVAQHRLAIWGADERLNQLVDSSLFAINSQYACSETAIAEGDEVALIPPVSGG